MSNFAYSDEKPKNDEKVKTESASLLSGVPKWAWIFVVGCGLLMIGGGAIPWGLAGGGAMACINTSKRDDLSVGERVARCLAITVGCWIAFFAIAVLVAKML